jgi:N6-adenosine-specific RNA methylase IME4
MNTRKKIKALKEEIQTLAPLEGEYDTIVIDPPWDMGKYNQASFAAGTPYPTMTIEEIKNMNVPAKDNCVLWLWTTNRFLHEAYHIIESWGFTPKSVLTWVKTGLYVGVWLRSRTEHCILAVKGKPIWQLNSQSTVITAKNPGHSIKPDEFYDLVDSLCYGRKLDYFAREPREGWITYGTLEGSK